MSELLIDILIGATTFAVAAIIATLFTRSDPSNKAKYYTVFAIALIMAFGIKSTFIEPQIKSWRAITSAEDSLLAIEPYPIIRERFPEDFNKLKNALIASLQNNDTKEQAIAKLRPIFMATLMSKLPISSNSALTSFNQYALAVLGYFHSLGRDEDAFNYIFDQSRLAKEWYKSLPKELRDGEMSLCREIFSSADPRNNANLDKVKAEMLIGTIASELVNKYGSKAGLLQNPQAPQNNRSDVVEIIIAYYSGIMKLPESDRGLVLRYSLSSS